jgi:hypothetical protein
MTRHYHRRPIDLLPQGASIRHATLISDFFFQLVLVYFNFLGQWANAEKEHASGLKGVIQLGRELPRGPRSFVFPRFWVTLRLLLIVNETCGACYGILDHPMAPEMRHGCATRSIRSLIHQPSCLPLYMRDFHSAQVRILCGRTRLSGHGIVILCPLIRIPKPRAPR